MLKVLHVTPAYYPATYWGGPIFSTYGLCNAVAATSGVELKVLTTDTEGPHLSDRIKVSGFPVPYPGGYEVYFTRRVAGREIAPGLLARLWPMVRWSDVVHLTGTYSFPTIPTLVACRILNKPIIWSPRGALLAAHGWDKASKPVLKKMWERVCRVVMPTPCVLHVTSDTEKAASAGRFPGAMITVIPNGVDPPTKLGERSWIPGGRLRVLFIGRLESVKGIENLLRAVATIDDSDVSVAICGTGEPLYTEQLVELANALGIAERVYFRGHVEGEARSRAFLEADVCVIPSHSESFGMVVAESLAHGVPVIASTRTPWAMLEEKGCGWWVENSPELLARAVQSARRMNLCEMGKRGREWVCAEMNWKVIANDMLAVYGRLVQAQP